MSIPKLNHHWEVTQWGCDPSGGWGYYSDPNGYYIDLPPTGTYGVDYDVLGKEWLIQAGYSFPDGTDQQIFHEFNVMAWNVATTFTVLFKLYDVTNDKILNVGGGWAGWRNAFTRFNLGINTTNIPTGDARIQLLYSLETGETAYLRYASWECSLRGAAL